MRGRDQTDRVFSALVRARDRKCMAPTGSCWGAVLHCAHIVSRRYEATRYDPENAMALCVACHDYWTVHPNGWRDKVDDLLGGGWYTEMVHRAWCDHTAPKWPVDYGIIRRRLHADYPDGLPPLPWIR